jgi:hypothetical protein
MIEQYIFSMQDMSGLQTLGENGFCMHKSIVGNSQLIMPR